MRLSKLVSDTTFQAAKSVLGGDRGLVDLIGTLGAYQVVAMMMVVDRFPLPEGATAGIEAAQLARGLLVSKSRHL
jgi:hypothetical protein